jgi:hypothetical protein
MEGLTCMVVAVHFSATFDSTKPHFDLNLLFSCVFYYTMSRAPPTGKSLVRRGPHTMLIVCLFRQVNLPRLRPKDRLRIYSSLALEVREEQLARIYFKGCSLID